MRFHYFIVAFFHYTFIARAFEVGGIQLWPFNDFMNSFNLFTDELSPGVSETTISAYKLNIYDKYTLLRNHPMIQSHDSASGYLIGGTYKIINAFAKTQGLEGGLHKSATFVDQLNCGARAFDIRPHVKGSVVYSHHGTITINHLLKDSLNEIVDWLKNHQEELVVLEVSHCNGGSDCFSKTTAVLSEMGIPIETNCAVLTSMTVAGAKTAGKMPLGGAIYAVSSVENFSCVNENYDNAVNCYGYTLSKTELLKTEVRTNLRFPHSYACYDSKRNVFPMNNMKNYLLKVSSGSNSLYADNTTLSMQQGHWQYGPESIAYGLTHGRSVLKDNVESNINEEITKLILDGLLHHINLLEVNNVCQGGKELLRALNIRKSMRIEFLMNNSTLTTHYFIN